MEVFVIILVGVTIVLSMIWYYRKYHDFFSPFFLIAAICFLVQVIGPLCWEAVGQRDYWGIPIMDYIIPAEIVFGLGYISFWVSFVVSKPKQIRIKSRIIKEYKNGILIDCNIQIAFIFWFLFLMLYIIYLTYRGRSFLSQLTLGQMGSYSEDALSESDMKVWFLLIALDMMIPICGIIINTSRSRFKYIVYLITVLLTISSGKRHLMLDVLLSPLIIHYTIVRKKPKIIFTAIIALIAFLLVGWIGAMRSVYRLGVGTLVTYDTEAAWSAVMPNLEVFKMLCIYIPNLKSLSDFSYGTDYIRAFVQLIPTVVFPFKSEVIGFLTIGNARQAIGGALLASGTAGTLWSGFYSNGWIIGVVIGMAVLGRWAKRMLFRLDTDRVTYIAEYAIMTSFSFQLLTRAFTSSMQTWFAFVLPLYLLRIVSIKENSRRRGL